jgi:hypothetical protein
VSVKGRDFEEKIMAWKNILLASLIALGSAPAVGSQSVDREDQATLPDAPEGALYCLKMEPVTGTRIGSIMCQTRQQWADDEVDLAQAWAEDGVEVIGG